MSKNKKCSSELPVLTNSKARHKFILEDKYEAGIVLCGTEVKSIRAGSAQITESYARFIKDELILKKVLKQYYTLNLSTLHNCNLVKGVEEFIIKFYKSKKIFVLTGADEEEVKNLVKKKKLNKYIFYLGGGPKSKIQHLKELQLKKQTIFFGDSRYDNFTASEYKFDFVFVSGYTDTKEENLEYNRIGKINDFSELV